MAGTDGECNHGFGDDSIRRKRNEDLRDARRKRFRRAIGDANSIGMWKQRIQENREPNRR